MAFPDVNDADILRAVGLPVIELPGWKDRGESGAFQPIALLFHHDGEGLGADDDPSNDMNVPAYMSQNGVPGAQKWTSRTGIWVMLAAGRKSHAGTGIGWGDIPRDRGNTLMDGLETDHTTGQDWPAVQMASIDLGVAALCRARGWDPRNCCGHKEYTRDTGRKPDPDGVDLNAWRARIALPIATLQARYLAATGVQVPSNGDDEMTWTADEAALMAKIAQDVAATRADAAAALKVVRDTAVGTAPDLPLIKGDDPRFTRTFGGSISRRFNNLEALIHRIPGVPAN